jgi:transmembrane sensor
MKPSSPLSPEDLDAQASLWATRIEDGELNETQCAELDAWLVADPRHRERLAEYCDLSTVLDDVMPRLSSASVYATPVAPRPSRWWWVGAGLAAAASLALVFGLNRAPEDPLERIATAIAECRSVSLSDGTVVELNAHTNLVFEATTTERRVRLGSGQAFFAVTKDVARPFIVDTPLGSVRVTGTAFDVRTINADAIAVTVAEGTVEVRLGESELRTASAPIKLTSHRQLMVESGVSEVRELSDEGLANELAWREGQLALDNAPLREVLNRFAHFHGIGISASGEVSDLRLSGRFALADLDDFLLILETVHPVRVIRDQSGTIRVVSRG